MDPPEQPWNLSQGAKPPVERVKQARPGQTCAIDAVERRRLVEVGCIHLRNGTSMGLRRPLPQQAAGVAADMAVSEILLQVRQGVRTLDG